MKKDGIQTRNRKIAQRAKKKAKSLANLQDSNCNDPLGHPPLDLDYLKSPFDRLSASSFHANGIPLSNNSMHHSSPASHLYNQPPTPPTHGYAPPLGGHSTSSGHSYTPQGHQGNTHLSHPNFVGDPRMHHVNSSAGPPLIAFHQSSGAHQQHQNSMAAAMAYFNSSSLTGMRSRDTL